MLVGAITPTEYRAVLLEFTQPYMDLSTGYIIAEPTTFFNPASILNPLQFSVRTILKFILIYNQFYA